MYDTFEQLIRSTVAEAVRLELRQQRQLDKDAQPVEPTWTNSNGETMRLRDMPTPYLYNVLDLLERHSLARGLYNAIWTELSRRRVEDGQR